MSISRQLAYQRAHKAAGLCQQCGRKVFKGGSHCEVHLTGNGKTLNLREKWLAVDWSLKNKAIAAQLGVSYWAVWVRRKRMKNGELNA